MDVISEPGDDVENRSRFPPPLDGARPGHNGNVLIDNDSVFNKDAVRTVVGRVGRDCCPTLSVECPNVCIPLLHCQGHVNWLALDVGDEPLG